jgi:hypothetical protein
MCPPYFLTGSSEGKDLRGFFALEVYKTKNIACLLNV